MATVPRVGGGFPGLLKDGYKFLKGTDEAVFRNIEACKQISAITRTSLGPNGLSKMLINHLDKLFVTKDSSTIMNEMEVHNPAAKLIVQAAQAQQEEIGDGTNLVITLGGELLSQAEGLIREGLHQTEVIQGYKKALIKALEILESLVLANTKQVDLLDEKMAVKAIRSVISTKAYGYESLLAPLVAKACISVCPKNPKNFNVDNVRTFKLVGKSSYESQVMSGFMLKREAEGSIIKVENAKVAAFSQGIDTSSTETKGTVLLKNASELQNYSKGEEDKLEQYIKGIADSGARLLCCNQSIGEMAMHFIEKYQMMAVKIPSKFDLRRLCRATGATALPQLKTPMPDELGYVSQASVEEIGGQSVIVLRQDASKQSMLSTIVLRGGSDSILEEQERACDDGINAYKGLTKDTRLVCGGGATEVEIARQVEEYGKQQPGLDQYAVIKFAQSLDLIPKILAENSGFNAIESLASLNEAHLNGQKGAGLDIETGGVRDLQEDGILDQYITKWWALKYATEAAITVLQIDSIIMAKQAGGPQPKQNPNWDEE